MRRTLFAGALLASVLMTPMMAGTTTVDGMLEGGELKSAYNPVVLDYLLDEASRDLPEPQREQAIDQLVTALRQDVEITPAEQKAAALLAAGAAVAQLVGGDAGEYGSAAGDATYDIWNSWIDSALTLQRAGYTEEAERFFTKCIEIYPYSDLRGRCAIGLAKGRPDEAVSRLIALTDSADTDTINASLRLLGELAGSEGFPPAVSDEVVSRLTQFTGGLKKATYGVAACNGLVLSRNQAAVPTLQKLSKGMMNSDFYRCARRGLLVTYGDTSVVPLLEKQLKGGKFSATEPWDSFYSAVVLMEGGQESGYAWAIEQFEKGSQKKGGLKGFMKKATSTEKKVDFRPSLVNAMVRIGGERSQQVLTQVKGLTEPGSWLETWVAIGLLELGDATHIDLARQALANPEWEFTTVRVATALAKHGDFSGIAALERLYTKAADGLEPETVQTIAAVLGGTGDLYMADRGQREQRLIRLRRQIANALATIDRPESVPVLAGMLGDDETSVRSAAAYGLGRMREPTAVNGLLKAMQVDYGTSGEASRNPAVHAYVLRRAAALHRDDPETRSVIEAGKASPITSVKFLSLCLETGATKVASG